MDYARYLNSKVTVDDRALNPGVLEDFHKHVGESMKQTSNRQLRIAEVGAGIGSMFVRFHKRNLIFIHCERVEYTMIDVKEDLLIAARQSVMQLAAGRDTIGFKSEQSTILRSPDIINQSGIHVTGQSSENSSCMDSVELSKSIRVHFVVADALSFMSAKRNCYDAVIGAAVLDLWDVDDAVHTFIKSLDKDSRVRALYFPIVFDGVTDLFPASSEGPSFDCQVEHAFHFAMGDRTTLGERTKACHSGRRSIPTLMNIGFTSHTIGGSTWAVYPRQDQMYCCDEMYFLQCIISFIESTMNASVRANETTWDRPSLERYFASRRRQLAQGTLCYVAHNIDFFCVL